MRADARQTAILLGLALPALGLTARGMLGNVPWTRLAAALLNPDPLSLPETIVHDAMLPRVLLAWGVGAGLSAAGVLLQRVLQNPLGSPTTFGLSGGASLALAVALLLAPGWIAVDRFAVALAGIVLVMTALALLAAGQGLSPVSLAVGGLLVSLLCGAIVSALFLMQGRALGALAIWGAGSLDQGGWLAVQQVAPRLALGLLAALLLLGPLHVMSLADAGARAQGVPVTAIRLAAMAVTAWLVAAVVAPAGAVGFVDLAAVTVVRMTGARTVGRQFAWSLPVGAAMLWLADDLAQLAGEMLRAAIPTGTVTGLFGAPMLVLLARRTRTPPGEPARQAAMVRRNVAGPLVLLAVLVGPAIAVGLAFGRAPHGWHWSTGDDFARLLPWRAPRVVAAAAAGALLAVAGVLTQRLTANPLASPEILGVGTVASLATVVLLAVDPTAAKGTVLLISVVACTGAFAALLAVSRRDLFAPTALLLAGLGLSAALGTGLNLVLAMSSLDSTRILSWITGSTYLVDGTDACVIAGIAVCGLAATPLLGRWLDLLPTGPVTATSLGMRLGQARAVILLFAAVMVGAATLIVGPFAFIGLIAPRLARLAGFSTSVLQCLAAAATGALILVVADFLGRNLFFPYQLPAGAVASAIGLIPAIALTWRAHSKSA